MNLDISHPQSLKRQTALKALVWSRKRNWNEEGKKGWLIEIAHTHTRGHWLPFRLGSLILVARTETQHPSSGWHSLSQNDDLLEIRKDAGRPLEELFKCSEPHCAPEPPDVVSERAEQLSPCHHPQKTHSHTLVCGHCGSGPAVGPCWACKWWQPWLVCGGWGAPTHPFLLFFGMLSQVGWAQNTFKNFPPLGCFLSCSVSPVWREVSRTVGGGGKAGEKYSTGISRGWAVQKEAAYRMTNL